MLRTARTARGGRLGLALAAVVTAGVLATGAVPAGAALGLPGAARPGAASPAGAITTVAGGVGGPAKATTIPVYGPLDVTFGAGRVYIAAGAVVRAVNPRHDWLTTPAGTGTFLPPIGDGGPATAANLYTYGTAVDGSGNLVIADSQHSQIQVAAAKAGTFYGQPMTAGHIYRVAGRSTPGFSGDGGPATSAQLRSPEGVAVGAAGNLLIADSRNNRIRMVAEHTGTFYGQAVTAGDIYTVAGGGTGGLGDGGPATQAGLGFPQKVAVDGAGNLLIADFFNGRIRVVAGSTGRFYGQAMTAGDIYTVAGGGTSYPGDGGPATSAFIPTPKGVAVDGAGNLLIADSTGERISAVAASTGTFYGQAMTAGDIYTVAGNGKVGNDGDGLPATHARLDHPHDVAVDGAGNLLIDDYLNARIRLVAAHSGLSYGQAMKAGHIYSIAGNDVYPPTFFGDGGPATHALLASPVGLARDAAGNLVIADPGNNRIRVVAAATGTFYGQAMTAGDIYTVAGDGIGEFSGDGGPATSAGLSAPQDAALDGAGNLVIADTRDSRIRVVAGRTGTFYGQAMTAGDIYTVAGNGGLGFSGDGIPATHAELANPSVTIADRAGNLVIADNSNNRVRVVAVRTGTFYGQAMTAGDIYTVAGSAVQGFAGDGHPATRAELSAPQAVAFDRSGNLVIADTENSRVRVVAEHTSSFYGQAMTAGDIYTIAGTGSISFSGDGGPGTKAAAGIPEGVVAGSGGSLLFSDAINSRIRMVSG
jgi:trimeric autotransporter adhesin